MKKKLNISWNDFEYGAQVIANFYYLADKKVIVGLSRGGLPLAVKLSNVMEIPMIPLVWQTRDGKTKDVDTLKNIGSNYNMSEVLFVDDICDSGLTIKQIKEILPEATFTTLINKLPQSDLVEFSPMIETSDIWITFPWE
jgi:xanthine phosphoribosyltransferase